MAFEIKFSLLMQTISQDNQANWTRSVLKGVHTEYLFRFVGRRDK